MYCPVCKDEPKETCFHCKGTGVVREGQEEQAKEDAYKNYEDLMRDMCS